VPPDTVAFGPTITGTGAYPPEPVDAGAGLPPLDTKWIPSRTKAYTLFQNRTCGKLNGLPCCMLYNAPPPKYNRVLKTTSTTNVHLRKNHAVRCADNTEIERFSPAETHPLIEH
jgi:hypothetical protein